jgi:hypothetical protein
MARVSGEHSGADALTDEDIKQAKDGSAGFDFEGTYIRIVPEKIVEYRLGDGRDVKIEFTEGADGVLVRETFEAESRNDRELQRRGWQAILDNFARHVEAKDSAALLSRGGPAGSATRTAGFLSMTAAALAKRATASRATRLTQVSASRSPCDRARLCCADAECDQLLRTL